MRKKLPVIIVISFLLYILIIQTSANSFQPTIAKKTSIFDTGVSYKVYETDGNGVETLVATKNSNEPVLNQAPVSKQPLSKGKIALVGSNELMASVWRQIDYANFPGDLGYSIISSRNKPNFNYSQELAKTVVGPNIMSNGDEARPSNVANGDVDGNFRSDLIMAFTTTYKCTGCPDVGIQLRVIETWGPKDKSFLINNYANPFGGAQNYPGSSNIQIPQILTLNLDNDIMNEFVVMGVENGKTTIWVFDDLMNSVIPGQIAYGQDISLRTKSGSARYISGSTSNTLATTELPGLNKAEAGQKFTLINPFNKNDNSTIRYGQTFALKSTSGNYWSVNNQTGALSLQNVTKLNSLEMFSFEGDTTSSSLSGGVYINTFGTIKSKTGVYVKGNYGTITTEVPQGATPLEIYKISNSSALPNNFGNGPKFIKKIQLPQITYSMQNTGDFDIEYFGTKSMSAGNLDSDSSQELVISGIDAQKKPHVIVLDDKSTDFKILKDLTWDQVNMGVQATVGDYNNDSVSEIAVIKSDKNLGSVLIYGNKLNNFVLEKSLIADNPTFKGTIPRIYSYDINQNKESELFVLLPDMTLHMFAGKSQSYKSLFTGKVDYYPGNSKNGDLPGNYGMWGELGFGDINQDTIPEMTTSFSYGNSGYGIKVYQWDGTQFKLLDQFFQTHDSRYVIHISIGDSNGDKFTLEYTDQFGQFKTGGEIMVVAAAPPSQEGTSQNFASTGSTFGKSVTNSKTAENEVTSSYGAYAQAQIKPTFFDVFEVGGEFQYNFNEEFTKTNTKTTTIIKTDDFSGGYKDDFVVYTTTIIDYYVYRILDSQDPRLIGTNFTLNVPRAPSLLLETIQYYNAHKNTADVELGSNLFKHVPGYVPSYHNKSYFTNFISNPILSTQRTVGQGGGSQGVQIDLSTEKATGFTYSVSEDYSLGGGATLFGIGGGGGATWGITKTGSHSTAVGQNTAFRGDIGSISNPQEYTDLQYSFGMAVYQTSLKKLGKTQSFYVMNYWVDLPLNWGANLVPKAKSVQSAAGQVESLANSLPFNWIVIPTFLIALPVVMKRKRRLRL